jgi:hypothetical protein
MILHWRLPLGRCVDAAPLVCLVDWQEMRGDPPTHGAAQLPVEGLAEVAPAQHTPLGEPQQQQQQQQQQGVVLCYACSHDGSVACADLVSGEVQWRQQLPHRADGGMCLGAGHAAATAQQVSALGYLVCHPCQGHMLSCSTPF